MKLLRNPWVTGALCVVAAATVSYQFLQPKWRRPVGAETPAPVLGLQPENSPARVPSGSPRTISGSEQPVDSNYAETHMAEWIDSPRHDPFLLAQLAPPKDKPKPPPSPLPRLRLKGIWDQTGSRLAAINNRVYREGDTIEGYTIEKIDADQVWFAGPDHSERLTFQVKSLTAESATNSPVAVVRRNPES